MPGKMVPKIGTKRQLPSGSNNLLIVRFWIGSHADYNELIANM